MMKTPPLALPQTPSSLATPVQLGGIQPPALFDGVIPVGYLEKAPAPPEYGGPMPPEEETNLRRPNRQGAPSYNPWDYVMQADPDPPKEGEETKSKARRRFAQRELEALEILWSSNKLPTKFSRQRLGGWLGV